MFETSTIVMFLSTIHTCNGTFPCKLAEGSGYYHEMVEVIMSKGNGIYYEW